MGPPQLWAGIVGWLVCRIIMTFVCATYLLAFLQLFWPNSTILKRQKKLNRNWRIKPDKACFQHNSKIDNFNVNMCLCHKRKAKAGPRIKEWEKALMTINYAHAWFSGLSFLASSSTSPSPSFTGRILVSRLRMGCPSVTHIHIVYKNIQGAYICMYILRSYHNTYDFSNGS